jgi:hypothetical protein
MLKKKEYHYGRDPQIHQAKMAQYMNFVEKHKVKQFFTKTA